MHKLELIDVQKSYKDKVAVGSTNVCFEHGVYGLLGENGAGKTTLMRMICGILRPDRGSIMCDGLPIIQLQGEYRKLLGYLPQDFGYYKEFTAWRFLNYIAALKAIPEDYAKMKINELLQTVDLMQVKDKKLKTYSGGMIRRVGIAQALLNEPEILVLDEPTSGLDPKERVRFRNIISSLGKQRIVILSTHIVSDVEYIADKIMIMKSGKLIQMGTAQQILKSVENCVWKCAVSEREAEELNKRYIVSNLKNRDDKVELRIVAKGKPIPDAVTEECSLEDAYLYYSLIGQEGEDYALI